MIVENENKVEKQEENNENFDMFEDLASEEESKHSEEDNFQNLLSEE